MKQHCNAVHMHQTEQGFQRLQEIALQGTKRGLLRAQSSLHLCFQDTLQKERRKKAKDRNSNHATRTGAGPYLAKLLEVLLYVLHYRVSR